MLSFRIFAIAAAFLLSTAALAERWIEYGIDVNGTVLFYDQDSLKQRGQNLLVWVLRDHSKDKTYKERTSKVRYLLDCANDEITILSFADYSVKGELIRTVTLKPYELEPKPIVPGSVGTALQEALCE